MSVDVYIVVGPVLFIPSVTIIYTIIMSILNGTRLSLQPHGITSKQFTSMLPSSVLVRLSIIETSSMLPVKTLLQCVLITLYFVGCSALPQTTATGRLWSTDDAVKAFQQAGLEIEDVHIPENDQGLPSTPDTSAVTFRVPTDGGANGYIFRLPSAEQAQQLYQSNIRMAQPSTPGFNALSFTYDNLFVMLFGNAPESVLRKYEAAIKSMQ